MSRCERASEQAGDVRESKGTVQYLRACVCLSGWLAARHQSVESIIQSFNLSVCLPGKGLAPRGKMSRARAGHDPSLGRINECTWSPPLLRYCG